MYIYMDVCPSCGQLKNTTSGCSCRWTQPAQKTVPVQPVAAPQGWQCPGCSRYLSPYVNTCPHCVPVSPTQYTIYWGSISPLGEIYSEENSNSISVGTCSCGCLSKEEGHADHQH